MVCVPCGDRYDGSRQASASVDRSSSTLQKAKNQSVSEGIEEEKIH